VLVNFLDSPGASKAKKEADTGKITTIGSLMDFDNWIDKFAIYRNNNFIILAKRCANKTGVIKIASF